VSPRYCEECTVIERPGKGLLLSSHHHHQHHTHEISPLGVRGAAACIHVCCGHVLAPGITPAYAPSDKRDLCITFPQPILAPTVYSIVFHSQQSSIAMCQEEKVSIPSSNPFPFRLTQFHVPCRAHFSCQVFFLLVQPDCALLALDCPAFPPLPCPTFLVPVQHMQNATSTQLPDSRLAIRPWKLLPSHSTTQPSTDSLTVPLGVINDRCEHEPESSSTVLLPGETAAPSTAQAPTTARVDSR
jgi:hypothetical protein